MPEAKYSFDNPGPCCQKIEDMIDYGEKIIERWPVFRRRVIGEDIDREMYQMLRLATKANLRYMNKSTLAELDTSRAFVKALIRRANRITFTDRNGQNRRLLSDQSYGEWSRQLGEIGALIGGWINSVSGRKSGDKRGGNGFLSDGDAP